MGICIIDFLVEEALQVKTFKKKFVMDRGMTLKMFLITELFISLVHGLNRGVRMDSMCPISTEVEVTIALRHCPCLCRKIRIFIWPGIFDTYCDWIHRNCF